MSSSDIAVAVSAVLLAVGLFVFDGVLRERRLSLRILRRVATIGGRNGVSALLGHGTGSTAARLGRRIFGQSGEYQEALKLVRGAGFFGNDAPYQFALLRMALSLTLALLGSTVFVAYGGQLENWTVSLAGIVGFGIAIGYLGPRAVVGRIATRRQQELYRELPLFLDTFLLLLRSGGSIEQCFRFIAEWGVDTVPTVHRSVVAMVDDIDQGRGYQSAVERWRERMGVDAADEIAGFLLQSLVHGTELLEPLGYFSQRLIAHRLLEARALAGRRTTHVTVAMMIFLMPPLMIVVGAPAFSALLHTFSPKMVGAP